MIDTMMESIAWMDQPVLWGVTLARVLAAAILVFVAFAARKLITALCRGILMVQAKRTNVKWDDELVEFMPAPIATLVQIGIWTIAAGLLDLPEEPVKIKTYIFQGLEVALWVGVTWLLFRITDVICGALARATAKTDSKIDDQIVPLIRKTVKVVLAITIGVMVVQNMGYSVTSLIASLGVGGLALALAAKDTVANLFGSVVVFTDQPFVVGDWVEFNGIEGTVEEVGFRTSRIRRFDKSTVTVPNAMFSTNAITNHSRRPIRRIKMTVGLTYETSSRQMRSVLERLRELIKGHDAIDQKFNFVHFVNFGASSLDLQIYCFTKSTVWIDFLEAQEDLMLKIMEIVEDEGLELAFPTRTVYLRDEQWGEKEAAAAAGA